MEHSELPSDEALFQLDLKQTIIIVGTVNYSGRRLQGFGMSDGECGNVLLMQKNNTGDRLCYHFKKAVETKKEMEDQLNLLIVQLNETDGQAIAKRLCSQISKTTNAVKQLVKEYVRSQTSIGSKYPSKILVEDALDINSSMWLSIDSEVDLPSSVPYCVKRQLIDLIHINNRCDEELDIIKEEMGQIVKFYEGKL
ncbi:hypothetical protein P5673_023094 [Acropora cervicornis]|uniref:Uncharacterized protein n=1 Tax=Acropora cervicornis TaxID=6130 RepID=A0AAD9UYX2_ACRCE|nr:hypothetical protein P5673_023094 [Acropora cervicornis]